MNRTLKYAFGAVLGAMLVSPVIAQDQFPDVPDNHWAYQALRNLKDSVLFGYPDGLYRGNRPMSRYEFAAAANQLYEAAMSRIDGLEQQISALEDMLAGADGFATKAEVQELRDLLRTLQGQMGELQGAVDDIAALRRMMQEFEAELNELGVNVDQVMSDLQSLEDRVTRLEDRLPAVRISGDLNFVVLGGVSSDNRYGLTQGGRPTGVGRGSYTFLPGGANRDFSVLHELALNLEGTNDSGPQWNATVIVGNLFDTAINMNTQANGVPFSDAGSTDIFVQNASVTFGSSVLGQGFSAEIGRVGHSVGRYLWQRPDYTTWYDNSRWDNGLWYMDGGILSFGFGAAEFQLFAGRNSNRNTSTGMDINPIPFVFGTVDQSLGAQLNFPVGDNGDVRLAYIFHDSNTLSPTAAGPVNRLNVFGVEADFSFNSLQFFGAFSQSDLNENNTRRVNTNNRAWDVGLGWDGGNWGLSAGVRRVERNFSAAGDWGRFGTIWNPTNFEGVNASLWFRASDDLHLSATGEFVRGVDNFGGTLGIGRDDRVNSVKVDLDYRVSDYWNIMLGFENVDWRYDVGTNPYQRWYTVGFGYNIGDNSMLKLWYMFSDVDFRGRGAVLGDAFGQGRYTGGQIGTQLSVRF